MYFSAKYIADSNKLMTRSRKFLLTGMRKKKIAQTFHTVHFLRDIFQEAGLFTTHNRMKCFQQLFSFSLPHNFYSWYENNFPWACLIQADCGWRVRNEKETKVNSVIYFDSRA